VPVAAPPAPPRHPAAAPAPIQTAPAAARCRSAPSPTPAPPRPLRERLASLGLVAFEVREDGLIKLLVGPFEAARLTEVRRQLAAVGIESFPR
jgi:hypothetical protein